MMTVYRTATWIKKINDYTFSMKSDNVQTEAELQVGQHIDFRG